LKSAGSSVKNTQSQLDAILKAQQQSNLTTQEIKDLKTRQLKLEDALIQKSNDYDLLIKNSQKNYENYLKLQAELENAKRAAYDAEQKLIINQNIQKNAQNLIIQKQQTNPEQLLVIQEDNLRPRRIIQEENENILSIQSTPIKITKGEITPESSSNIINNILKDSIPFIDDSSNNPDNTNIVKSIISDYAPEMQTAINKTYDSTIVDLVKTKVLSEEKEKINLQNIMQTEVKKSQEFIKQECPVQNEVIKYIENKNSDLSEKNIRNDIDKELINRLTTQNEKLKEQNFYNKQNKEIIKKLSAENAYLKYIQQEEQYPLVRQIMNIYVPEEESQRYNKKEIVNDYWYEPKNEDVIEDQVPVNKKIIKKYFPNADNEDIHMNIKVNSQGKKKYFKEYSIVNDRNNDLAEYFFNQYSSQ